MLESNGKDRQDYHVFADMAISSVSINWLRSKPTEWQQTKIWSTVHQIQRQLGMFSQQVCVWTLIWGRGAQTVYMFNYPPSTFTSRRSPFFACPSCGGYVSILYRLMHMVAGEACPMRDPRKYQDYIDLFQFSQPKSNSSFTDFNQQENSFWRITSPKSF